MTIPTNLSRHLSKSADESRFLLSATGSRLGALALVAAATLACTGAISSDGEGTGSAGPTGMGPGPGGISQAPKNEGGKPFHPVPAGLRRLTNLEYANTVKDLLGQTIQVPALVGEELKISGFTSAGAYRSAVNELEAEYYQATAYSAIDQVLAAGGFQQLMGCAPAAMSSPCVSTFLEDFLLKAWRRPATEQEQAQLLELGGSLEQKHGKVEPALRFVVAAILQSPHFLYITEVGREGGTEESPRLFGAYAVASRLAYAFWASAPDAELLESARTEALLTPAGLSAQVQRLLGSPRAKVGLLRFLSEQLQLDGLLGTTKDPSVYSGDSATLVSSMREETQRFVSHAVLEGNGDLRNLLSSRRTFVNQTLAPLYGTTAPGAEFQALDWPADGPRAGLLGLAGFLAQHSHASSTSPTLRGKFIAEQLLCQTILAAPGDVDTSLPQADATGVTLRERLQSHAVQPRCAGCHNAMDPLGFGLEGFDALGRERTEDNGRPVNTSAEFRGTAFTDAVSLSATLQGRPEFAQCMARQFYRYTVGHEETPGEEGVVEAIAKTFVTNGYRLEDMAVNVVNSDGFRWTRHAP